LLRPQIDYFCRGMGYEVVFHAVPHKEVVIIYEDRTLTVETIPLKHRVPCCGYLFREKAPLPHIRKDMMDYLAYQTLQKNGFVRLPSDCDFMIMSDVRNFIHISVEGDDYDMVYLYFPNDVMGCTITKTLKDRYGKHAIECNPLYKGYNNLLQFVKAIEITTNIK